MYICTYLNQVSQSAPDCEYSRRLESQQNICDAQTQPFTNIEGQTIRIAATSAIGSHKSMTYSP